MLAEEDRLNRGQYLPDALSGFKSVQDRHADIEDDSVRAKRLGGLHERLSVAGVPDDLELRFECRSNAVRNEHVIICEQDTSAAIFAILIAPCRGWGQYALFHEG